MFNQQNQELTFRERCALIALERFADKVFDPSFKKEARDADLEPSELVAAYCWSMADEMVHQASV